MAIEQQGMTLEAFLALSEEKPALEYRDGRVTQKEMPKGTHGWLQSWLVQLFNTFSTGLDRLCAFTETRVTYAGISVVPDVCVYVLERAPVDDRGRVAEDFVTPPDLIVEISSPGQSLTELRRRCQWFVDHDVQIALLVHPRGEWIERFESGHEPRSYRGDQPADLGRIAPGLAVIPSALFGALQIRPR